MIDFIKFVMPKEKYFGVFYDKDSYGLEQRFDVNTGTLMFPMWGGVDGFKIKITSKHIELSGSIHKYWNLKRSGVNANCNDFNLCEVRKALDLLARNFSFNLEDATITNMEFGVNIIVDVEPTSLIQKNILIYKDKEPKINDDFAETGKFIQFDLTNYAFKIYDKGRQYNLDERVLRVELKSKKSVFFTGSGVKWSLVDLKSQPTLRSLGDKLLEHLDNLMICDDFERADILNTADYPRLLEFKDSSNWVQWKRTLPNKTKNRRKGVFAALREKYGLNTTHSLLRQKIATKIDDLLKCP